MAKYLINKGSGSSQEVEADQFMTVGDFVDFSTFDNQGDMTTVFRIRADHVVTVEIVK